jgi:hypothetical protein
MRRSHPFGQLIHGFIDNFHIKCGRSDGASRTSPRHNLTLKLRMTPYSVDQMDAMDKMRVMGRPTVEAHLLLFRSKDQ